MPRDGPLHPVRPGDVVAGREQVHLLVLGHHLPGQRVQRAQLLDLVAEELDPDGELLVHREHLEGVAADPEGAAGAGQVVARVLDADQPAQQRVPLHLVPDPEPDHPADVLLRRAQAVDRRDGRHHDHVAPGEQRVGGRVPQPLDLLVERGVLLDVGVGLRDVRLGLVVVVVRDEVLHRVAREELPQLVGELGGQGLVGLHHQDRALQPLRQPGHGRRLAGAGRAQQHDVLLAGLHPPLELGDRRRLVTRRGEVGLHLERGHPPLQVGYRTHHGIEPMRPPPTVRAVDRAAARLRASVRRVADGRTCANTLLRSRRATTPTLTSAGREQSDQTQPFAWPRSIELTMALKSLFSLVGVGVRRERGRPDHRHAVGGPHRDQREQQHRRSSPGRCSP